MSAFLTILIIVGCLGLVLFVLVQNPKGGGLNSEFGSAVQLGGAKRATDILEKGTWGLAAGIGLICLVLAKDVVKTTGDAEGNPTTIETDANAVEDMEPGTTVPPGTGGAPAGMPGQ
jgi:preprotein translocase subunit SecG